MTPQSAFTIVAPVSAEREGALRMLLERMNGAAGFAKPDNDLVPFGKLECLHFARFVILEDPTLGDLAQYGAPIPALPTYLAFFGDCDGPSNELLEKIVSLAEPGLREIFSYCEDFHNPPVLLDWLLAHDLPIAANYVNWVGRTVVQIKEEAALQRLLARYVRREPITGTAELHQRRRELLELVDSEVRLGRLSISPCKRTPLRWRLAQLAHLIGIAAIAIIALPVGIVLLPLFIILLRRREKTDPEICPRPDSSALQALTVLEDLDVTNQYSAFGSLKPGLFRRWLLSSLLVVTDYVARHVFTRGFLARVQTIHFARWVFLDGKSRVLFASNYDGGHQAYMDDFINKVAWGLNVLFSSGIGWPRTDWLIRRGCRREHLFKFFQRRHQIPTQVWYKAYPGLTLIDLERNHRIRQGLQARRLSDSQVLAWLKLL